MLADELPRVPLRPQQPAAHYPNGRAALNGPHLRTGGRERAGGTADIGGAERKRRVELDQINVAVPRHRIHRLPGRARRPRARPARWSSDPPCKQFAPRALHVSTTVAIAARYLTLVVNELLKGRVLPPLGRATTKGHLTFITEAV